MVEVSGKPAHIPDYKGAYKPVYEVEDFVWWDVSRWCP